MNVVVHRPRANWQRHYPTAKRIAAAVLADPALLALRTTRIEADAVERFGVNRCTARLAVAFARRAANNAGDCASRETSETSR